MSSDSSSSLDSSVIQDCLLPRLPQHNLAQIASQLRQRSFVTLARTCRPLYDLFAQPSRLNQIMVRLDHEDLVLFLDDGRTCYKFKTELLNKQVDSSKWWDTNPMWYIDSIISWPFSDYGVKILSCFNNWEEGTHMFTDEQIKMLLQMPLEELKITNTPSSFLAAASTPRLIIDDPKVDLNHFPAIIQKFLDSDNLVDWCLPFEEPHLRFIWPLVFITKHDDPRRVAFDIFIARGVERIVKIAVEDYNIWLTVVPLAEAPAIMANL